MSPITKRKLNYYLRLQYPVRIVAGDDGLTGAHPDLPGCSVVAESVPAVYASLELARREWITGHIASGDDIPLPNAHLTPVSDENEPIAARPQVYVQREATPF